MKTNELVAGQVYSYGSNPNQVINRFPVVPLDATTYYQLNRPVSSSRSHLDPAARRAYSSRNPERGLLVLHTFDISPGAIRNLAQVAQDYLLDPAKQLNELPKRDVTPRVQWVLVNPAFIRQPWDEHLERKAKLEALIEQDRAEANARRATTDRMTHRLHELVQDRGLAGKLTISRYTVYQQVPNSVLLELLEAGQS